MVIENTRDSLTSEAYDAAAYRENVGDRVRTLNRIVTRIFDNALSKHGITGAQLTLLVHIREHPGITAAKIGDTYFIEKSSASRNLKRLKAAQLIEHDRTPGIKDRRGIAMRITPLGERKVDAAWSDWKRLEDKVAAIIGSRNQSALADMRKRLEYLVAE